jgi:hypothetical protein
MKAFTFIIGTMDDFDSMDALLDWFEADKKHEGSIHRNAQYFEFDAPESCDQETVTMIGRGLAFSSDWCLDDTYSCVIEGTL